MIRDKLLGGWCFEEMGKEVCAHAPVFANKNTIIRQKKVFGSHSLFRVYKSNILGQILAYYISQSKCRERDHGLHPWLNGGRVR